MGAPRLELRGIRKAYPSVVANDGIDLAVAPGEIHAVLGENGAGKTTLMKIIYGVRQAGCRRRSAGKAAPVHIANPAQRAQLGIGMVFQHFSLFETLTVAREHRAGAGRRAELRRTCRRASRECRQRYGLPLDPRPPRAHDVGRRAAARRDRPLPAAEPAPADHGRADVGADAAGGRQAVRDAAPARGRRLQHPLHQPQAGRDPRAVPRAPPCCAAAGSRARAIRARETHATLARMMIGGELPRPHHRDAGGEDRPALVVDAPRPRRPTIRSARRSRDIDLTVRAGEIVGIAGVSGNGQKELLAALSGERTLAQRSGAIRSAASASARVGRGARRRLGLALRARGAARAAAPCRR